MADDPQKFKGITDNLQKQINDLSYSLSNHKHLNSDLTTKLDGISTTPVELTDAATITVNAQTGSYFFVTLGGNRTLGNPTGAADGQRFIFEIIQDGTGSRTLAFDTKFAFGATLASVTVSTGAGKRDFIGAIYRAVPDLFYIVAFSDGY